MAQTSIWTSIIPASLRSQRPVRVEAKSQTLSGSKRRNPATFFIVMFMLIGSQAIQMIALRAESATYSRRTEAKIGLLKDVIERVQAGERIDVEALLGTGDEAKEKEWEDGKSRKGARLPVARLADALCHTLVLQELENEDGAWQARTEKERAKGSGRASTGLEAQHGPELDSRETTAPLAEPRTPDKTGSRGHQGFY